MSQSNQMTRDGFISLTAAKRPEPKTNMEFVYDLMNFSPFGSLSQLFVIQAIGNYAEAIAKQPKPPVDTSAMINPRAWHNCAEDVLKRWEGKYGKKD
jgi:hypothetical protein